MVGALAAADHAVLDGPERVPVVPAALRDPAVERLAVEQRSARRPRRTRERRDSWPNPSVTRIARTVNWRLMRQILQRAAIFALVIAVAAPAQDSRPQKKLLFLTHSAGYVHDVVKRPAPDQLSFAEKELTAILNGVPSRLHAGLRRPHGQEPRSATTWWRSTRRVSCRHRPAARRRSSTGFATAVGSSGSTAPLTPGTRCPLMATWSAPFSSVTPGIKPCVSSVGRTSSSTDEIYQFKNLAWEPLDVVLNLDLASVDATKGNRPDRQYPLAWLREYGNGRVFYLALGHTESAWQNENFRRILLYGAVSTLWKGMTGQIGPTADAHVLLLLPQIDPPFVHRDQSPLKWRLDNRYRHGSLQVVPGAGDVISKERFGDFSLHLEFRVPEHPPTDKGQARGNSGVYLQDRYEIQILDSFGLEPKADDCGAIYGKKAPLTNACRKPGEWQSYDVGFKAARFDAAGKKTANARASVWQNGLKIHDDVEIDGPTARRHAGDGPSPARCASRTTATSSHSGTCGWCRDDRHP